MAQVLDITALLSAAQSADASVRNAAEQQLQALQESQYASFLLSLSAELSNNDKPVDARRLAGLVLKNTLDARDDARKAAFAAAWVALDPAVAEAIRSHLLNALSTEIGDVRHTAALAVAKVAALDLPRQAWPALVGTLLSAQSGEAQSGIQRAALETLGYVCEELGAVEEEVLAQEQVNSILTAVVRGMGVASAAGAEGGEAAEVRLAATVALNNALEFARRNVENPSERDYIMQVVCSATLDADPRVRRAAWECLVSVAANFYAHLPAYMSDIFSLSQRAVRGDEEAVALQALEFWCTVCEEEAEAEEAGGVRGHGFVAAAQEHLVPLLLEQLTKQEEGAEAEEGAWNVSLAAGTCLGLVAGVVEDAVVPLVMPLVQAKIGSQNWREREAATFAFGSILEGPSRETLRGLAASGLAFLLAALRDPSTQVKNTTAWTLGRMFEFVHGPGMDPPLLDDASLRSAVAALLASLRDETHVAEKTCYALSQLAAGCDRGARAPASAMSPYFQDVVAALLGAADAAAAAEAAGGPSAARLQTQAFEAANEVVRASAADCDALVAALLPSLAQRLRAALSAAAAAGGERGEREAEAAGLLCGAAQVALQRLCDGGDRARELLAPLCDEVADVLLGALETRRARVAEEALLAAGALSYAAGPRLAAYMPRLWPALDAALGAAQDASLCAVAVGLLGDVCRALEGGVAPWCDGALSRLLCALQAADVPRALKPQILSALGDVALALGDGFEKYAHAVLPVLRGAMSLSLAQRAAADAGDEDAAEYNGALRHGLLEAWAGLLNGLSRARADALLPAHAPALLEFVESIARDAPEARDEAVWKAALALLGDVAAGLSGAGGMLAHNPAVQEFVRQAGQMPGAADTARWTQQMIARAARAH